MATDPCITQAVAQSLLTAFETAANAGTAAVIQGYAANIGRPADADAANTNTLLFTLTCAASLFTSKTDGAPNAVGTLDTVTDDSSADASATLDFFRMSTQSAGTVVLQGVAGTSASDLNMNTLSITSASTISLTSGTITVQEQT